MRTANPQIPEKVSDGADRLVLVHISKFRLFGFSGPLENGI